MNKMKKIILFIVEGLSDRDALEPILAELIDGKRVHFEVLRCDALVNTEKPYYKKNVKERITLILKNYLVNNRGIEKKHIEKVVYITDTDGCYIKNNCIHYSEPDDHFRYEDDGIYSNQVEMVEKRNEMKSHNLDVLSNTSIIYDLLVETYYFSCNLDHVLHGIRNLDQSLKEEYANHFSDQYENKENEFIDFILDKSPSNVKNYKESWDYIKKDLNSLSRSSNLGFFFINNKDYLKNEIFEKELIKMC